MYLVVGLGTSGASAARSLAARGEDVVVVEEHPSVATRSRATALRAAGVEVREAIGVDELGDLVRGASYVVPSPGVPAHHPVFSLAGDAGVPLVGDVELASRWTSTPIVAVTGTNGKTTVTSMVAGILEASGMHAVAAGNIGLPALDALEIDADVFVIETSSFQLALTEEFRPRVAVWLNVAHDHLDAHGSFGAYVSAKARIWANQKGDDLAILNADDEVIQATARWVPARRQTFGLAAGDWHVAGGMLVGPDGQEIVAVDALPRSLPHDLANAMAATAAAIGAGASLDAARSVLTTFASLPHRVTLVGDAGGVRWYDDSKATNPHAALAAIAGFDSVVLIAGGRNKGLDLGALATAGDRIRAVVAIGESAGEVEAAFRGKVPVTVAHDMDGAVAAAGSVAQPGDAVLLSPGCASFDWYANYGERGDDFARAVHEFTRGQL